MPLSPGSRIGPYEITAKLGEGGMGEVYRARDTKLNRQVAIKALPASVGTDPERISRFEREAQILASLHHRNIAGIYGLEQSQGATYLILELVDGRPLDVVLETDGPFAPSDAVAIARQIADAIAAAHEKGIIHRDLKPANVMLSGDGHVTVLDFGLGKSLDDARAAAADSASANSPTITLAGTQAGLVLGTAGYMSPEQAKGRAADRRSDVWSFGCLLFELLAGSRAFDGEDVTDTIAAIVRGEPNMSALPATPPALRQLIERTLIKDRNARLPDMSVVRYILNEPGLLATGAPNGTGGLEAGGVEATGVNVQPRRRVSQFPAFWRAAMLLSTVLNVALAIALLDLRATRASPSGADAASHFTVVLPDDTQVAATNEAPLALAADGRTMAFIGEHAGRTQLYVTDFSTGETKALEGTDDAKSPFFSPDGRWIGFFGKGRLKKVTVGGTSLQIVAASGDARGGTWSPDDVIYYAPTNTSGLWKVPASGGGSPVALTKLDPAASEISHRYPYALPDGKGLLFVVWTGPGEDEHRIEYLSLVDHTRQVVVQNADGPVAVTNGHLVYAGRQDALVAAPWSASRPSLQGVEPRALPFFAMMDHEGAAAYAVSGTGTIVRLAGSPMRRLAKVVWIDRSGHVEPLPVPDRDYVSAALSPDDTRAAIQDHGGTEAIWIYDLGTRTFTPLLTPEGSSQAPVWTTDSKSIVYRGTRHGSRDLYRKSVDGSGTEERLTDGTTLKTATSASPDGKSIIFFNASVMRADGSAGSDIWKVALDGRHEMTSVITSSASSIGGQVSPDGRWIAYQSLASGRSEIVVRPFATTGGPASAGTHPISHDGGVGARWSRDGRELYFLTPDSIMATTVTGDTFSAPRAVVQGHFRLPATANTNYDVARDGRFLQILPTVAILAPTRIEVVLNGATWR